MNKTIKSKLGASDVIAKFFKWVFIIFFVIMTMIPLIWLIIASFKTNLEYQMEPFALPKEWQFQNYIKAMSMGNLPALFMHSVIVAVGTCVINLLITSMASFVIAREKFKFNNLILSLLLAGVMIPIIALMVPYYKISIGLGLYDSLFGLIITYTALNIPISIFLIHGFMLSLPKELEEASVIDGCNFRQRFFNIVLPLTKPGLVTAGTLLFIFCWNEFTYAMLLTSSEASRTLQLGIRYFKSQFVIDYTSMLAAIVITMLPTIFVYIFLHDKIISGMTTGAVKG
jgi:raffinose/stachyose/melibiose transport system permease protein